MKAIVALAGLALATAAHAATLYENSYLASEDALASGVFSVSAAALFDLPPSYGGQVFSVSSASAVRSASFTELDSGSLPSIIRWGIYSLDDTAGAPLTELAAGDGTVSETEALGGWGGYQRNKVFFNLPGVALGPGSYLLALQVSAPTTANFLVEGQAPTGAWEKFGSEPWQPRYGGDEGAVSVAVGLYDAARTTSVPEPASWALMVVGFVLAGRGVRRAAKTASPAPSFGTSGADPPPGFFRDGRRPAAR